MFVITFEIFHGFELFFVEVKESCGMFLFLGGRSSGFEGLASNDKGRLDYQVFFMNGDGARDGECVVVFGF